MVLWCFRESMSLWGVLFFFSAEAPVILDTSIDQGDLTMWDVYDCKLWLA